MIGGEFQNFSTAAAAAVHYAAGPPLYDGQPRYNGPPPAYDFAGQQPVYDSAAGLAYGTGQRAAPYQPAYRSPYAPPPPTPQRLPDRYREAPPVPDRDKPPPLQYARVLGGAYGGEWIRVFVVAYSRRLVAIKKIYI